MSNVNSYPACVRCVVSQRRLSSRGDSVALQRHWSVLHTKCGDDSSIRSHGLVFIIRSCGNSSFAAAASLLPPASSILNSTHLHVKNELRRFYHVCGMPAVVSAAFSAPETPGKEKLRGTLG